SCFPTLAPPQRPPLFPYTTLFRSVDPDSVLLLERGGERLAVGHRHGAVEHHLPLFLRARNEPRLAIGALVHVDVAAGRGLRESGDRKSTRLNSSHVSIPYAVLCL